MQAESKEQQEAELVRRMRDAFQHGVQVVRSSLEFVDLNQEGDSDEDSEDEGAPPAEPLFRSRDPYLHRALPLLIGSQAFVQDDRVGLGDLLSEGACPPPPCPFRARRETLAALFVCLLAFTLTPLLG